MFDKVTSKSESQFLRHKRHFYEELEKIKPDIENYPESALNKFVHLFHETLTSFFNLDKNLIFDEMVDYMNEFSSVVFNLNKQIEGLENEILNTKDKNQFLQLKQQLQSLQNEKESYAKLERNIKKNALVFKLQEISEDINKLTFSGEGFSSEEVFNVIDKCRDFVEKITEEEEKQNSEKSTWSYFKGLFKGQSDSNTYSHAQSNESMEGEDKKKGEHTQGVTSDSSYKSKEVQSSGISSSQSEESSSFQEDFSHEGSSSQVSPGDHSSVIEKDNGESTGSFFSSSSNLFSTLSEKFKRFFKGKSDPNIYSHTQSNESIEGKDKKKGEDTQGVTSDSSYNSDEVQSSGISSSQSEEVSSSPEAASSEFSSESLNQSKEVQSSGISSSQSEEVSSSPEAASSEFSSESLNQSKEVQSSGISSSQSEEVSSSQQDTSREVSSPPVSPVNSSSGTEIDKEGSTKQCDKSSFEAAQPYISDYFTGGTNETSVSSSSDSIKSGHTQGNTETPFFGQKIGSRGEVKEGENLIDHKIPSDFYFTQGDKDYIKSWFSTFSYYFYVKPVLNFVENNISEKSFEQLRQKFEDKHNKRDEYELAFKLIRVVIKKKSSSRDASKNFNSKEKVKNNLDSVNKEEKDQQSNYLNEKNNSSQAQPNTMFSDTNSFTYETSTSPNTQEEKSSSSLNQKTKKAFSSNEEQLSAEKSESFDVNSRASSTQDATVAPEQIQSSRQNPGYSGLSKEEEGSSLTSSIGYREKEEKISSTDNTQKISSSNDLKQDIVELYFTEGDKDYIKSWFSTFSYYFYVKPVLNFVENNISEKSFEQLRQEFEDKHSKRDEYELAFKLIRVVLNKKTYKYSNTRGE